MQILGPDEGALPEIPPAPLHEHLLLESPFLLSAGLAILAVILLVVATRIRRKTLVLGVSGLLLILALGVQFLASRVVTQREMLEERTEALVAAVATSNENELRRLLAASARVQSSENATGLASKFIPTLSGFDSIWLRIERHLGPEGSFVGSHKVLETRPALEGENTGRVLVRVRAQGPGGEYTNHSWWDITWKRSGDDWLATRIEAIWIQG